MPLAGRLWGLPLPTNIGAALEEDSGHHKLLEQIVGSV